MVARAEDRLKPVPARGGTDEQNGAPAAQMNTMTTTDAAIAADFAQLGPIAEREACAALGERLRVAA